ncbi:MAG TPA: DNA polymerase III subunit alpha [Rhodocyclaceae bacterium]|nr:DNA polymerase III subunit alpha [Rhodocyclaceae bacterium]
MSAAHFVHLRLHSEFSITDGIVRLDHAIARAKADGMPAMALTDLANLFGMVKFYSGMRGAGLKPVIGCDVWIGDPDGQDRAARLLLLAKNRDGYLRLCDLLSVAYTGERADGRAEIPYAALAGGDNTQLIALSGGPFGDIGQLLVAGKGADAVARARHWAAMFPGSFYIEVQRPQGANGSPQQETLVHASAQLAGELFLPLIATHPIQFMDREDFKAHEARTCIAEGYVLADPRRPKNFHEEQYFKTQAEMAELFADYPEALENTVELARRCNVSIELGKPKLPLFPTPDGMSLDDFLALQAHEQLEVRLEQLYPDTDERDKQRPRYTERLDFEIGIIQQMGFPGYFLIVADFITWAKKNGVPVGPGRGSGAGSLVAYSLGITDLDPLAYDLLFERFLNPERVSMPDFDIDFCQDGRDRVIQYVKDKYGHHAVSQIATFGTMAAKAVIRDCGRVLDLPFNFVDQFAKLIPNELGISLAEAYEKEPQMKARVEQEEELAELWELATKLEGMTRNIGMHAGGVLISPGKLTDFCPLYAAQGTDSVVSQFDKDDVEKVGLVKFDFLGLRTLTILDEAVKFVKKLDPSRADFRLEDIPLDDKATYGLFASGNTTAVFQSESRSAKDLEKRLRGDNFEDIIALMALNRPGPLGSGMVDDFINRKKQQVQSGKGNPEWYFHEDLEPVLKSTYGVMVYQEQVMLVAQVMAGYTLGGADMLRRAMGKKKAEEMAAHRQLFVEGAGKRGVSPQLATQLFDLMEKFADYGFNKSHSAAYALVAFQTGWLKHYYPTAFMAATMSSEMADTDKVQIFYQDCLANNIKFLPPDVNASAIRFEPTDAATIRYGLGAIKGTGEAALSALIRAREKDGPFKDLFDFCRRVDKRVANRRVVEALIRAGAFDAIDADRAKLFASVGIAIEAADQAERNALQSGLFDMGGEADAHAPQYVLKHERWDERRQLLEEKQALGFFYSGHPFNAYRRELAPFVRKSLAQLAPSREPVLMAGVVLSTRTQMTRRGKMAVITLDDATAQIEVTVFNELWDAERAKIKEDELLLIEGKISHDDFSGGLRVSADKIMTLGEARGRFARALQLSMNGNSIEGRYAEKLRVMLTPYRNGACPVRVAYRNHEAEVELGLSDAWRIRLDDELLISLREWLQPENVKVIYP